MAYPVDPMAPVPLPVPKDSWRTANVVLTSIAGVVLVLGWGAMLVYEFFALMGTGICGMSCDAAQVLFGRLSLALGIGAVLSLVPVVGAFVWRRWSSLLIGASILIVIVSIIVAMAIGSTPLSEV